MKIVARAGQDAAPTCAVHLGSMSFLPDAGRRDVIWSDETFNTLKPSHSLDKYNNNTVHRGSPVDGASTRCRRLNNECRGYCPGHGTPSRSWQQPQSVGTEPVTNGFGVCARKLLHDGSRSDQLFHARRVIVHQSQSEPRLACARRLYPSNNGATPPPCNGQVPTSPPPPTTLNLPSTPHRKHHSKPSVTSPTRLHTISENLGLIFKPLKRRKTKSEDGILTGRSSSIPSHLDELNDSDSDDDDYGFRSPLHASLPVSSLSPAMQKAKATSSTTAAQKILPKKWRKSSSNKTGKSTPCLWRPEVRHFSFAICVRVCMCRHSKAFYEGPPASFGDSF
ncbi:hypothetical protein NP493_263g02001 [Ridgeia piscesae]|uniref:Uncharacterized protein n=1 Tax=Ridgeia piscesae TaxID=27915 RepID=A0AAD9UCS1_RIDPI|nr:hypothetical protein NP493_263g02001 [Ridgeia piscesae]